jgi:type III pantothenate kinase
MNLAIDIGNSFTHLALFDKKRVIKRLNFPSNLAFNIIDEKVKGSLGKLLGKIEKIGLASVVPLSSSWWNDATIIMFKLAPLTVNYKMPLPINIKVKKPESIGADRICNAVFAFEYFKGKENVIIADYGTANTYDVVLKNGDFIGGIIAPGIDTSAKALSLNTGKLPLYSYGDLKPATRLIGRDTREAIHSGLLSYPVYATEGIVRGIEKDLKRKFKVLITGGSAKKVRKLLTIKTYYAENAVLEGINMILNHDFAK